MSARCQVTGAVPGFSASVPHSHRRTRGRVDLGVQRRTHRVPSLGRKVRIDVSARGTTTIDRRGLDAVVADGRRRGEEV